MKGERERTDYSLTNQQATTLAACALLPADERRALLARYAEDHGDFSLADAFAQFIGLANSVVANGREMGELLLITDGDMHPQSAERVNWPTIFGAVLGAKLANRVPQDSAAMCGGCAYRRGTIANQCLSTFTDAEWVLEPGEPLFVCHEHEGPVPTSACAGYALAVKGRAALSAMEDGR